MRSETASRCHSPIAPNRRSLRIDNAKVVLIMLVVWGHLIEQIANTAGIGRAAYAAIYLFHMPAFVMIAGMNARATMTRDTLRLSAIQLLVPLALYQILYFVALSVLTSHQLGGPITPIWILWFLLSLFTWRLVLPVFVRLPHPILLALALALGAGWLDGIDRTLSLSRSIVFFPAFLIGHLHGQRILAIVQRYRTALALLSASLVLITAIAAANGASLAPLFGATPYSTLGQAYLSPMLDRLVLILAGTAASVGFLALIPDRQTRITWLAPRTMTIFLLHGFIAAAFWHVPLKSVLLPEVFVLTLTAVLAILVTLRLAYFDDVARRVLTVLTTRVSGMFRRNLKTAIKRNA